MKTNESNVVRGACQRMRWTQLDLPRRVGCSESQVAKTETGRVTEPAQWLKEAIARELGISTWEAAGPGMCPSAAPAWGDATRFATS